MENGTQAQKQLIRDAIEHNNGMDNLDAILSAMQETGALSYAQKKAEQEADKAISALSVLEASAYKDALIALAHIAANRSV